VLRLDGEGQVIEISGAGYVSIYLRWSQSLVFCRARSPSPWGYMQLAGLLLRVGVSRDQIGSDFAAAQGLRAEGDALALLPPQHNNEAAWPSPGATQTQPEA
jgi:hypothetical protein